MIVRFQWIEYITPFVCRQECKESLFKKHLFIGEDFLIIIAGLFAEYDKSQYNVE